MATPDLIHARPEVLHRFAAAAGAMADGLDVRWGALGDAVAHHRLRTEPAYRVDGDALAGDLRRLGHRIRRLGEWVGGVGVAFDRAGHDLSGGILGIEPGTVAIAAAAPGARPPLAAARAAAGRGSGGGGGGGGGVGALRIGIDEAATRWDAEADRPTPERAVRAIVDGALNAGGAFLGADRGSAVGAALCGPAEAAAPSCVAAGGVLGAWAGRQLGEWLSDRILGPEPEPAAPAPGAVAAAVAAEVGDVDEGTIEALRPLVDDAASDAAASAGRRADITMAHPWMWDDAHPDAPHHPPPPPAPVPPSAGPR